MNSLKRRSNNSEYSQYIIRFYWKFAHHTVSTANYTRINSGQKIKKKKSRYLNDGLSLSIKSFRINSNFVHLLNDTSVLFLFGSNSHQKILLYYFTIALSKTNNDDETKIVKPHVPPNNTFVTVQLITSPVLCVRLKMPSSQLC